MKLRLKLIALLPLLFLFLNLVPIDQNNAGGSEKLSSQTKDCIDCHSSVTPGIVEDWRQSRHSKMSFASALAKPALERRVSSDNVAANLNNVVVGCYECHGLNPDKHTDNFEHFGYKINVVVSPNDCAVCHEKEAEQYAVSKKANAHDNLMKNPVYNALVETIDGVKNVDNNIISALPASHATKGGTCLACHGTEVKVVGKTTVQTDLGDIEVPKLSNWPNQGVGRINPDGSKGACTPCHPRHSFSLEVARKPYTCAQCHLEPDVPAFNIYKESKHGNIYEAMENNWQWENVPWVAGKDFKAPTCAVCHNSLIVSPSGDVIAERSHDFASRLWVRVFGLIYSHTQPRNGKTYEIKNSDGLPLPTTFTGAPATKFLLDPKEAAERKHAMTKVCSACHNSEWVSGYFERFDKSLKEADAMVLASTKLMKYAWDNKLADNTNPFDEALEQKWVAQWLFYANSVRYSAAMSGPDYATFKNGWWNLTNNLNGMHQLIKLMQKK